MPNSTPTTDGESEARVFVLWVAVPVLLLCVPLLLFSFWAEPLDGDLTRVGHWTERDYGYNALHVARQIAASGLETAPPAVLVLGDSFSVTNLWQSGFTERTGQVTRTYRFDDNRCIDQWVTWAARQPYAATIVLEIVERNVVDRLGSIIACPAALPIALEIPASTTRTLRPRWPPTLDLGYLLLTAGNTVGVGLAADPTARVTERRATNVGVKPGCGRFSHRRQDRMLYDPDDDWKRLWQPADIQAVIAHVLALRDVVRAAGKTFVLLIPPDKLSVYRDCIVDESYAGSYPNIIAELRRAGVRVPDLLTLYLARRDSIVDLYYPNNTHWGEAGARLAAMAVLDESLKETGGLP